MQIRVDNRALVTIAKLMPALHMPVLFTGLICTQSARHKLVLELRQRQIQSSNEHVQQLKDKLAVADKKRIASEKECVDYHVAADNDHIAARMEHRRLGDELGREVKRRRSLEKKWTDSVEYLQ